MKPLIIFAALILSGCATSPWGKASGGSAVYEYSRVNADGSTCTLRITSARTVAGGDIEVGPNCELKSKADDAGGAYNALEEISNIASEVIR